MAVKKIDIKSKNYILMYSVLGHPVMLFEAFETKSGAINYLREQENVSEFTLLPIIDMFDFKRFEVMG